MSAEPGSFRDRDARVFHANGEVFRALNPVALNAWRALAGTQFFSRAVAAGEIVGSDLVDVNFPAETLPPGSWAGTLRHETIPVVSYPYEWCFSMLKDAALLQLDLLRAALEEDMTMKDATPFNILFNGSRPVFIDVSSFEPLEPGEPWLGYRQFCQLFLYPLLLQAYRDVPFQPWLRGRLDGIEAGECRSLLSLRDVVRPGVLRHVHLHSAAQRRAGPTAGSVRSELRAAGFPKALIAHNVKGLRRLVESLSWNPGASQWSDYASARSCTAADHEAKAAFVNEAAAACAPDAAWDLGCNAGDTSRVLARHARTVVALDRDHFTIDKLYARLRAERNEAILPLVMSVTDPSPALGWRGTERRALVDRGRPDLVLCLALIHHVVIDGNVPLPEFVAWLADLTDALVIEFVTKDDPMTKGLLRNKRDNYDDYEIGVFERCLANHFRVERREPLSSGTRFLYFAVRPHG